jgi:hypothetical protein
MILQKEFSLICRHSATDYLQLRAIEATQSHPHPE